MFFQFIIAMLLGFSSPKQTAYTNHNNNKAANANGVNAERPDDGSDTGGEGGQTNTPR